MNTMPQMMIELQHACSGSLERPDFHPERTLDAHIELVVEKATLIGNPNLIMSAMLHDLWKPQDGDYKKTPNGVWYWSNPKHAEQAADWILREDDVKHEIWIKGANWRIVEGIVRYHMQIKNLEKMSKTGKIRLSRKCGAYWNELILFRSCDDMIGRYK